MPCQSCCLHRAASHPPRSSDIVCHLSPSKLRPPSPLPLSWPDSRLAGAVYANLCAPVSSLAYRCTAPSTLSAPPRCSRLCAVRFHGCSLARAHISHMTVYISLAKMYCLDI
ncbi:hypothetical protein Scep_014765 [Stephania cephalantha]|uniref:Uncharacterized protein n=1 Tax=Stephania cephalantha TaxID=152367 RepID=A0AAP0P0T1_9MAGN